jgi:type I restriction enzyme S subunit
MIEGLKPYAEYKESGQQWLGSVPNHWSVLPNRALFDEVKDRNHPKEEMLSVTITRGIVRQKALLDGSSKKDSSNLNKGAYKLVQPHDIAYNKMRAWQGALGASTLRGIISPAYVVMRPRKEANPWFYHNLYRTPSFAKEAERWSYGITSDMWSLRPEHFKVIGSVLPPPDEQAAIVRFLDHANRKIDGWVRAKRKLIGLLNEQKQAIIHRAVTRGLHPDAPLKPSGIPWLGDIPKHWTVAKLKHLTRFQNGLPFKPADWKAEGIPIIRIQNLNGSDDFNYTIKKTLPADLLIRNGDLMFAWSGNKGTSFGSFQWDRPFDGYLNQHIFKLTGFKIPRRYFYYVLRAVTRHVEEQAGGIIGLVHVTKPELSSVQVPIASAEEQENIAQYIDVATAALTTAIARTEREIALMQEYRTRLTADIVTGKLDVREAAAKLPDLPTAAAAAELLTDEALNDTETEDADA